MLFRSTLIEILPQHWSNSAYLTMKAQAVVKLGDDIYTNRVRAEEDVAVLLDARPEDWRARAQGADVVFGEGVELGRGDREGIDVQIRVGDLLGARPVEGRSGRSVAVQ